MQIHFSFVDVIMIDKILNKTLTDSDTEYYLKVLNRCANRESMPQFYHGVPREDGEYFTGVEEVSNQDFLGLVKDYDSEKKMVTVEQRNYFKVGDVVEFFGPNLEPTSFIIPDELYDEKENLIDVARHPKMLVRFKCPITLGKDDMMRVELKF